MGLALDWRVELRLACDLFPPLFIQAYLLVISTPKYVKKKNRAHHFKNTGTLICQ